MISMILSQRTISCASEISQVVSCAFLAVPIIVSPFNSRNFLLVSIIILFQDASPSTLLQVLTIAVLSIILTAPAGAVAIAVLGPLLLQKSSGESNVSDGKYKV